MVKKSCPCNNETWKRQVSESCFKHAKLITVGWIMVDKGDCVYVCLNTKVRCKPRNATNFNQKVKMLKTLSFRYDTET